MAKKCKAAKNNAVNFAKSLEPPKPGGKTSIDANENSKYIESLSPRIRTVEQALRKGRVDTKAWEVERSLINHWEMGMRGPDGKVVVTPLWQVKVWLKRKNGLTLAEFRDVMLADMIRHAPKYPAIKRTKTSSRDKLLYEVSIFDAHFGNLAWLPEVGANMDLRIIAREYRQGVIDLLDRVQKYKIDRILFPIGNDFLHTDNARNTTHAGTPQDVDGRWQKAYMAGKMAIIEAIEMMMQIAPVDVLVVPGNHDHERMFYLGDSIYSWFHRCKDVQVNNSPLLRKYYGWGTNLLGFTHGCDEKHHDLPRLMSEEADPKLWVRSRHREWHTGHLHKRKEMRFVTADGHGTTIVRTLPGLTGLNAWHYRMGYNSVRAAEGYLWSQRDGYAGHFPTKPLKQRVPAIKAA